MSMNGTGPRRLPIVLPVMLLAVLALLFGLWAGLLRLGWRLPGGDIAHPVAHGPLMVSGFLGTVIILERAVALKRRWMFIPPLLSALGTLVGLSLPGTPAGPLLVTLSSLGAAVILAVIVRREPKIYTWTMAAGAFAWLVGNLFWLAGWPIARVVLWWVAFLVLTVSGERLELSRVLRPKPLHYRLFAGAVGLFLAGVALSIVVPDAGVRLAGLGLLAVALWLVRYDIARRNLRHPAPLTRFIAACLFSGYFWLAVGGLLSMFFGWQAAGPKYDAVLHSIFLGFVFSMIFGHAPIILPAVLGTAMPFSPVFYSYLALLHASLVLRIGSDLAGWREGRLWGGLLNEVALVLFLLVTIFTKLWVKTQRKGA